MPFLDDPEMHCQTTFDPVQKIWSGIQTKPTYEPNCSIGEAVLRALLKDPEHICQICHHNGKEYTNQEIANLSIRIAQHFQKLGVKQMENIGIVAGNTDYLAPLVFGALLCGLTICPMDPTLDKEIIITFYEKAKPIMVFTEGAEYQKIKDCLNELGSNATIYTINDHMRGVPEISEFLNETEFDNTFNPEPLQLGYNQVAGILRSSGTSGTTKSVCVTHAGLLNNFKFLKVKDFDRETVLLRNTTIYWISGLSRLIAGGLQGITSIINEGGFKSSMIPQIMKRYRVTYMYSTPHLLVDILKLPNVGEIDFSPLKLFYTGGCCVPHSLIEKAKTYMTNTEFRVVYGCSEVGGTVSSGACNPEGHNGQLVPNMELKIVDNENNNLDIGEAGEICTRSIFPWPGYYKAPSLTATVYRDGWIYSGDWGYINKDGNLFVLERKSDVLKYKDHSIYPIELENIISEIPDVIDVCVCGLSNVKVGQLLAAAVQRSEDSNLTAEEIYKYVAERVEDHKKLRGGVYFTNFIPKTRNGKKLRKRALDICESQRRVQLDGN